MSKPVLAVTLGDVAGIGPEITARTLLGHPHLRERCVPVVIGDEAALRSGAQHRLQRGELWGAEQLASNAMRVQACAFVLGFLHLLGIGRDP